MIEDYLLFHESSCAIINFQNGCAGFTLQTLAARGCTVLVSSHLLAEVAQTVDQIVIIDHGRLLASGSLDELTRGGQTLEDVYLELTAGKPS